jgi:hypothetical protein
MRMAFALIGSPPDKTAQATPENVAALDAWLGSIVAFRALTHDRPWTFYEQLETYLGPWGESGYPVGYGIKYCKLFFLDEVLRESQTARAWVHRTLILLQLALKDFVLKRFRAGTLASVCDAQFKQAAFDSHPLAYTEGGLSMVVMLHPLLTLYVASLPAAEFNPLGKNFVRTMKQVLRTSAISVPQCMAMLGLTSAPFAQADAPGR